LYTTHVNFGNSLGLWIKVENLW